MKMKRKLFAAALAALLMATTLAGCAGADTSTAEPAAAPGVSAPATDTAGTPKYVFLFIGDGMSYPQVQLTNYYLSATKGLSTEIVSVPKDGKTTEKTVLANANNLKMMNLPVSGSAQTYDSTSFAPDSASTATSIATGNKTWSGSINVSEDFTQTYETIAEKLKAQKGYKIGILSTVNLNHATPAAFYAHQVSRGSYYEIGLELIDSGFDYFAGGGLLKPTGTD